MGFKILLLAVYNHSMWENQEELGICSIGAFLREKGYETVIKVISATDVDYSEIMGLGSDLIGITTYDTNKADIDKIAENIRKNNESVQICIGGSTPTCHGGKTLNECSHIDYAISGEGELAFYELVSKLEKGQDISDIPNLIYRQGDKIVENPKGTYIQEMDLIPFPSRDMLINQNIKTAQLFTSRGCTANCSFCASKIYYKSWRGRSVKHIIDEIEYLKNNYGIRAFNIIDGSFEDPGVNRERLTSFANEIIKRGLIISYYVHFRAESFRSSDMQLLRLLKKSGLTTVCIGMESGNELDLKLYNKRASMDDVKNALSIFTNLQINIDPGFINFNPYTDLGRLEENVNFLRETGFAANPDYFLKNTYLYKGTSLYEKVKKDNLLLDKKVNNRCFNFRWSEVSDLFDYVWHYLQGDEEKRKTFAVLCHSASFLMVGINCMKHLYREENNAVALKIMQDYSEEVDEVKADITIRISDWFHQLIRIAKTNWNKRAAMDISNEMLPKEYLNQIVLKYYFLDQRMKRKIEQCSLSEELYSLHQYLF